MAFRHYFPCPQTLQKRWETDKLVHNIKTEHTTGASSRQTSVDFACESNTCITVEFKPFRNVFLFHHGFEGA